MKNRGCLQMKKENFVRGTTCIWLCASARSRDNTSLFLCLGWLRSVPWGGLSFRLWGAEIS
jgi:hypothetical protein